MLDVVKPLDPLTADRTPVLANAFRALAKGLKRIVLWPAHVAASRRLMNQLAEFSDQQLSDIGITRGDVASAAAAPLDVDPSVWLMQARFERRHAARRQREETRFAA